MMEGLPADLPQPLRELDRRLCADSMTRIIDPPSDHFGDQIISYSDGVLEVRFVRERAKWLLGLGAPQWNVWSDPDVWRGCLDGEPIPLDLRPMADRAVFVAERLSDLRNAIQERDSIRACVEREHAALIYQRLGIPQPPAG
jgi:hypothetical protein